MKKLLIFILLFFCLISNGQGVFKQNRDTVIKQGAIFRLGRNVVYDVDSYNDYADALFARMDSTPNDTLKAAISTWYDTIQYHGILDSLHFSYCFAVQSSQAAALDWIRDTTATLVNSPTFTAKEGLLTDGATSYMKSNYNPGLDATQNSFGLATYIRTNNIANVKMLMGIYDGTNFSYIRINTTTIGNGINTQDISNYAHGSDISGFAALVRIDGSNIKYSRNGTAYTNLVNPSTGVPSHANGIYIGAHNLNGATNFLTNNQFSFAHGFSGLSEEQIIKLYEADERFLDTFGKGVNP